MAWSWETCMSPQSSWPCPGSLLSPSPLSAPSWFSQSLGELPPSSCQQRAPIESHPGEVGGYLLLLLSFLPLVSVPGWGNPVIIANLQKGNFSVCPSGEGTKRETGEGVRGRAEQSTKDGQEPLCGAH
ncbi:hypothetical protein KIL84_000131 [Mauremys mutica]|uniref:Uncharacterized protein n=1 Tax=Mauremys mutica TaxID=74926 RepID=A0A9D4B3E8_9SAUR|nr:hypothetical protein KIL84_000131 [Mauremys mutica]